MFTLRELKLISFYLDELTNRMGSDGCNDLSKKEESLIKGTEYATFIEDGVEEKVTSNFLVVEKLNKKVRKAMKSLA